MVAEAEGDAESGGRWRETRSGEAWEKQKDGGEKKGDADTQRKEGRREDRGQAELTPPRQAAASAINNMCPMCDRQSR